MWALYSVSRGVRGGELRIVTVGKGVLQLLGAFDRHRHGDGSPFALVAVRMLKRSSIDACTGKVRPTPAVLRCKSGKACGVCRKCSVSVAGNAYQQCCR